MRPGLARHYPPGARSGISHGRPGCRAPLPIMQADAVLLFSQVIADDCCHYGGQTFFFAFSFDRMLFVSSFDFT